MKKKWINWRSVENDGYPSDENQSYLVVDGKQMSISGIRITYETTYSNQVKDGIEWSGDPHTWEDHQDVNSEERFDLTPTHWCPIDEINFPK